MDIDFAHPIRYTDSLGDSYKFYFFTSRDGVRNISIGLTFKDSTRTIKILGYHILGEQFAVPIMDNKIMWYSYVSKGDKGREQLMSPDAMKFAEKFNKLKAFL